MHILYFCEDTCMKIGVLKEIKPQERRVALTPPGAAEIINHGHSLMVEKSAGLGSGFTDAEYEAAGAEIIDSADIVWQDSEMIIKVKEPIEEEFSRMREGQVLFTYLHLAADERLTRTLLEKKVIGIAYETVQTDNGLLPLLTPMSEIAGRLSVQAGCRCLETINGGRGLLLAGVPGVRPAEVTILGGGVSGINAAHLAAGMGARVTIIDVSADRMRYIEDIFHSRVVTIMSSPSNIRACLAQSDLVIGAVLIPGAKTPKLVKKEDLNVMKKGAAIVDIAIDQGGCTEMSRPTTHAEPAFMVDGVVLYCVANMPGAVPLTSTYALTNVTLPYALQIADRGADEAIRSNSALRKGLNVYRGKLTSEQVAQAHGMNCDDQKIA